LIHAVDGKQAAPTEDTVENPHIVVGIAIDVLAGIMDRMVSPTTARVQQGSFPRRHARPDEAAEAAASVTRHAASFRRLDAPPEPSLL
jgi:hypothetical protein